MYHILHSVLLELCLRKRYDDWDGFLFHAIFFEVKSNGIVGYAEYRSFGISFIYGGSVETGAVGTDAVAQVRVKSWKPKEEQGTE